ncbi:hypothetical protein K490DRAFT_68668 [Saccharata proteae CBS 121410]|uniref:Uncharacterized protein n=1 Tax=Saccharata proteae CBS 121410 TaxID=1314787 RepID=A0A9P4HMV1_9PEZI|nr:hypothetical protein K490DRAFT_68668 [Saccharata proteae CBS 121410]
MTKVNKTRIPLPGEKPEKAPKIDETKRKVPPQLSEETIVESDDASDSESNSGASEGSESDAEKLKSSKKPDVKKVGRTEVASPEVEDNDSSEEDSGSETSSDESSDESMEDSSEAHSTNGASQSTAGAKTHNTRNEPPPPFKPPHGFKATSSTVKPTSSLSKLLAPSHLAGKQIWHITAPAAVPLTSIKEIALEQAKKGEAILQHDGIDYGFVEESKHERRPTAVLVPGPKGYETVKSNIAETLHLQQVVRLPNLTNKQADQSRGSDAAAQPFIPATKPVRQQPKGLRMRFHPVGFEDEPGVIGSSESEAEDVRPQFRMPQGMEYAARAEKRKREENEAGEAAAKKARKEKKKSEKSRQGNAMSSQLSQGIVPNGTQEDQADAGAEAEKSRHRKDKKEKKKKKRHSQEIDGGDPMGE